jgi:hypothetical protein
MTGFLIRGTKEKSEGDVFHGHHLHQIPIWTRLRVAFPCFILWEQFGNNSGTDMLAQHARSAASCMVILAHNRRNGRHFPLFPYLLLYRTEEVAGSNPARSTDLPPPVGDSIF